MHKSDKQGCHQPHCDRKAEVFEFNE